MIIINNGSLSRLFSASATGPFMQAEIVSLTGKGKLRVTCNWLYSSLNCTPEDNSPFVWQFSKVDDQHISLSPVNSCIHQPTYTSVRDDYDWYLQMQAPYSADWITAVQRDEIIGFTLHDLFIGQFNGFNGSYIALNDLPDSQGGHSGYRLRSIGSSFNKNAQWFISIKSSLQQGIAFSRNSTSRETVLQQLQSCNISLDETTFEKVLMQIGEYG
jgi:hypothetical protein